jgi:branched-chain amino acid transport system permease protein
MNKHEATITSEAVNASALQGGRTGIATQALASRTRYLPWLLAPVALAVPLLMGNPFYLHLAILICLNVVIVGGLSLLSRTGQLSFCHAAFVGMGAYGSALAVTMFGLPFPVAAAIGTALAAGVAFVLGAVILRLRGVYFVLVTYAFGELFRLMLLEGSSITGGANGIAGIPAAGILGFELASRSAFYVLAVVLACLSILFHVVLFRTPRGHAMTAVGENPSLAEASGLSVRNLQLFAFTIGSGLAGAAGACLAHYVGYISPESFSTHVSVGIIVMLVVGGRNLVLGPLIGALIMTPLPELFRGAVQTQNIFYGVTVILILRFLPQGLASLLQLRRRAKGETR